MRVSSNATCLRHNACISDEEVDGKEGDKDDAVTYDTNVAANDAVADDKNYATMPPKLKAPPRKPTTTKPIKKESNDDVAAMPPPAPKPPMNLSVDSTDKFLVSYHVKGKQDIADMVFHINGVLRDTNYRVSVVANRNSVLWQHAIQSVCFTKKILQAILKNGYSTSSHRAIPCRRRSYSPSTSFFGVHRRLCALSGSARLLQPSSSANTLLTKSTSTRVEGGTASATWSSLSSEEGKGAHGDGGRRRCWADQPFWRIQPEQPWE